MPSKIDIVTRNRTVYAGASPPTVDVGMFTIVITGVDLKTAGTTTVFTVPTSRSFVCTNAFAVVTATGTPGAGVQNFQIKESSSARAMTRASVSTSSTPVAGQSVYVAIPLDTGGQFSTCMAGNAVQVIVTTSHAGSTTVTGSVFVQGFYVL